MTREESDALYWELVAARRAKQERKGKRKRQPTPRERIAAHLETLGILVFPENIRTPEGGQRRFTHDILERWNVTGKTTEGKRVEVTGLDNLTKCLGGIELVPNYHDSCVYGDFVASAKPRARGGNAMSSPKSSGV